MANVMDSDFNTEEARYTYSTSYSRTVRTTVMTTDENGIVNTQQSTVTTNSGNPPVSTTFTSSNPPVSTATFTTVDSNAERKNHKIAWLICLVAFVTMGIFCAGSLVLMLRFSFLWGMVIFSVGTVVLPVIMVMIRQKLGYGTRGRFRRGGVVRVVNNKSSTVHVPPPVPQSRAMSQTSIITNQFHTHAPPPVGTTNVNQNFGANQFQTEHNSMTYPYASTTQGYQTQTMNPGYETQQNIWAQPVGNQEYSPQPSSAAYPPPPPLGPYADPPPSYESAIR